MLSGNSIVIYLRGAALKIKIRTEALQNKKFYKALEHVVQKKRNFKGYFFLLQEYLFFIGT